MKSASQSFFGMLRSESRKKEYECHNNRLIYSTRHMQLQLILEDSGRQEPHKQVGLLVDKKVLVCMQDPQVAGLRMDVEEVLHHHHL